MRKGLFILLSLLLPATIAQASEHLMIEGAYARATPPNAPTSAVFFTAHNHSEQAVEIISATTDAAGKVELHTVVMDGDVMQMRQVEKMTVEAGGKLMLKPGSFHVMLFDLTKEFAEGDSIEVTLTFSNGDTHTITAPIKKVMSGMTKHEH
jgi:copper(I)-binding protein